MKSFKKMVIEESLKDRNNTVILSGKRFDRLVVQSPLGSQPINLKMNVPGRRFTNEDEASNKKKEQIIKAANDKINKIYEKLIADSEKIMNAAVKKIEKIG